MQGFAEGFRKSFNLPSKNSRLLFQVLPNNHYKHCVSRFFFRTLTTTARIIPDSAVKSTGP
jgi:hypothetical protein